VRGHDPASRRIIEDEAVEEERAGAGDPTDPQPPKVRSPIPLESRGLIRRMALENPLWGQERIANELLVKLLGIQITAYCAEVST
jgi:hypothetical protein